MQTEMCCLSTATFTGRVRVTRVNICEEDALNRVFIKVSIRSPAEIEAGRYKQALQPRHFSD